MHLSTSLQIKNETRQRWILVAMGGVLGLILLDETVVGVALPTIRRDLGMGLVASHWVINGYLLVFAGLAAAAGKFGDVIGFERLFLLGVGVFALASLACGAAPDGGLLIAGRAIQGIGAAMIFPTSIAILTRAFPPQQRGMAFGVYGGIGSFFLAVGPLVGGFFTDVLSWRWIFLTTPPIAVVIAFILMRSFADPSDRGAHEHIDLFGLVTLVAGLGMFVFAIMQGPELGWDHALIIGPLIGGLVVLGGFILIERRAAMPLINVDLFRNPAFAISCLVIFTAMYTQVSLVIFMALYLQDVLHFTPLLAGLGLLPAGGVGLIFSAATGRLADRIGPRPVAIGGLAVIAVSLLWIGIAAGRQSYPLLLPGLVFWGIGLNALFIAPRRAALNAVAVEKQGQAGGVLMTAQLLGGTIGVTVCGTIYAVTERFEPIYVISAGLAAVVLAATWRWMRESAPAPSAAPSGAAE